MPVECQLISSRARVAFPCSRETLASSIRTCKKKDPAFAGSFFTKHQALVAVMIVMVLIMMVAMVLVVPVTLMHLPAITVVVIVRVAPIRPGIGGPLPHPRNPHIPPATNSPVAIDPHIARTGHSRPHLIPQRRRRSANGD